MTLKKLAFACLAALLCAAPAAAAVVGCVYETSGAVEVRQAGSDKWLTAKAGLRLSEADAVRTGRGAKCVLLFREGSYLSLGPDTEAAVEELKAGQGGRQFSFSLLRGRLLALAAKLGGGDRKFRVRTPTAVCAVRGTDFSVLVSTGGESSFGLFEGVLALTPAAGGPERELQAGGEASAAPGGPLALSANFSPEMEAEKRGYGKVKARAEALRRRLQAREDYLDDFVARREKKIRSFMDRQREKLDKR